MEKLSPQQFSDAISRWDKSRTDLPKIKTLFGKNSVFNLHYNEIQAVKNLNKNDDFCVMIGVSELDELIMIPVPLDEKGNVISLDGYNYSAFEPLKRDLCLTEKQTFTVVKKSVLSTKMRKTDSDSDIFFPIINKPVMEQEKALEAIDSWQNSAFDWFYSEQENYVAGIFTQFIVPTEKIFATERGIMYVTVFGLKFSEIYQKMLPALIFISAEDYLSNQSVQIDSNTLDFAKPCPPY